MMKCHLNFLLTQKLELPKNNLALFTIIIYMKYNTQCKITTAIKNYKRIYNTMRYIHNITTI